MYGLLLFKKKRLTATHMRLFREFACLYRSLLHRENYSHSLTLYVLIVRMLCVNKKWSFFLIFYFFFLHSAVLMYIHLMLLAIICICVMDAPEIWTLSFCVSLRRGHERTSHRRNALWRRWRWEEVVSWADENSSEIIKDKYIFVF